MTHQCLKIMVKPLTFHHKNMFIVFTLITQVKSWNLSDILRLKLSMGVQGTWIQGYEVHSFGGTGVQDTGT